MAGRRRPGDATAVLQRRCLALALLAAAAWPLEAADEADEAVCDSAAGCDGGTVQLVQLEDGLPPMEAASGAEDEPYPRYLAVPRAAGARVWSAAELARHRGTDVKLPLLLCVLGEIFDVGTGAKYYSSGGYSIFAGADRSRAFTDTKLNLTDEEMSGVVDLEKDEFRSVTGWRNFYRVHETYRFVGYLNGRYFDAKGEPTDESRQVEALHLKWQVFEDIKDQLRKRWKSCNSRHEQDNTYFEIWCDDAFHLVGSVPVHLYAGAPGGHGEDQGRCACMPDSERAVALTHKEGYPISYRVADYPECKPAGRTKQEQRCRRPKGSKPPP